MQVHWPEPVAIAPQVSGTLSEGGSRRALAGFFVSGVLLSFLGAILLTWEHHLAADYGTVGLYFLGVAAGLVTSVWISPRLLESKGVGWTLALACGIAGASFLYLAFVSPPFSAWWRIGGLLFVGSAAGMLHTAMFHAILPMYRHDPAATINVAGILFGLGCFAQAILLSGAFYWYTAPALQAWLAVIPAAFGWMYRRTPFPSTPVPHQPPASAVIRSMRDVPSMLLSALLFFQLGSEWVVAGWLPLFVSQRLGSSPKWALWILAIYWLALSVGRVGAQWVLPRLRHSRLLLGSVVAAMFGCFMLSVTNNEFGAIVGVLLLGGAWAPIYPLVVEKIGHRFPSYHPGFYNGLFSFALAAGLLSPALCGYVAHVWGVRMVMMLPLAGSAIVFLLLLVLWLEARLGAHAHTDRI